MPKVLVTGPLGNVGRAVVRACTAAGQSMRLAGRIERLSVVFPQHERAEFDFYKRETWAPALRGCDQLFLLRPPQIGDMSSTLLPLIDAAREYGVGHIVFLSVAGADRMNWVPHRKVELHLAHAGWPYTLLRPGFFAQNLKDAYLRDIVEDARLYVPAGNGRIAFLDVQDVGEVAVRVLQQPSAFLGAALTLTGPEAVTFYDVASLLEEALKKPVRYEPASALGYAWHLLVRRRLPSMQVAVQTILHLGLRRGDASDVDATVERVLGRPARSLEDYLVDNSRDLVLKPPLVQR